MTSRGLRPTRPVALSMFAVGLLSLFLLGGAVLRSSAADDTPTPAAIPPVSYHQQIRPIFQARCHGCHQPAKAKGKYVMTSFDRLLKGGDSDDPAIVPGQPGKSALLDLVQPLNGKAEMPKDEDPLSEGEIELIERWIKEGAKDDTPANARQRYDADHPPVYLRPPVISSLDYSPDGSLLAVAGFHEVLLAKSDGSQLVGRLIGMSQRITSVRFSPDGKKLAVTGGLPARMGEVQVWNVAERKLEVSVPVTYDTVYGASWSPDGSVVAFACADKTVRAIRADTGEQVFFNGAHDDWALDTVFTVDGKQMVSVGRDMTAKLHEFAEQRFIDNITSITPGALKGGILAVARHPQRDEIVIGGSDGQPRVYRIQRLTKRVIGDDANIVRDLPAMRGRVNAVAVSRDGKLIAAGSSLDSTGQVFVYAYDFDGTLPGNIRGIMQKVVDQRNAQESAALEQYRTAGVKAVAKVESPDAGVYAVAFSPDGQTVAAAGSDGVVRLIDATAGTVRANFSPAPVDAAAASAAKAARPVDFIVDVNPVLSRAGCNAGTCHGGAKGKNGFKLSLRGYDALFDVRALTDDHASRRVDVASPDDSLMLLKATGAVPHEGGRVIEPGSPYYAVVRDWIAGGAKLKLDAPRVAKIDLTPQNPVLDDAGARQPMKVVASYTDGSTRDVTREAFIETGNGEVAKGDREGVMTSLRRGEAPILARYEGAYAATTLTVMGDRTGFAWKQPETWGPIDELVAKKWERMKIQPSDLAGDAEFLRRVYLDLTGLPPSVDEVRAFLADTRPTRTKRDEVIDKLIGSEAFVEYWTNKWADLLQVNGKFLGRQGATSLRQWIRGEVAANTPYDDFARKIIAAEGSNKDNPPAAYYKVLRSPDLIMENTTHLFLGIRFNCNKCHDHPFERWTQDQYFHTAAYFARVDLKPDPAGGNNKIGGTAVEDAKPLYEIVSDKAEGEITHERTGQTAAPAFPYDCKFEAPADADRRDQLAAWLTSSDNPYFARSYVNRLWGYLFGVGIIEPIDDIRAGNPPTNPQLLDYLTEQFIASGFDTRKALAEICKSRTYQLSFSANKWNEDDAINFSHAMPRRLPAEVLFDAIHAATGAVSRIPGVPPGTRAAALPDSAISLPSGFLDTFGKPARESACECERSNELQLGPVMALVSGPDVADAIADPNNAVTKLVASQPDDKALINELYLRILNRPATDTETTAVLAEMRSIAADHEKLAASLAKLESGWADHLSKLEQERQDRIAAAQAALDTYRAKLTGERATLVAERDAKIAKAEAAIAAHNAGFEQRFVAWEKSLSGGIDWRIAAVESATSNAGVNFAVQDDRSILASGPAAASETRTVTLAPGAGRVTALRLEAMTHPSLPKNGPGRAPDGNFVLNLIKLAVVDAAGKATPVKLVSPTATFSQANYAVTRSIEEKIEPKAGWAIHPNTGRDQTAFYALQTPIDLAADQKLVVTMEHRYPDGPWTLGRFRFAVTDGDPSVAVVSLAPAMSGWHHAGPFQASNFEESFDKPFDPEVGTVDLGASYADGKIKWVSHPEWTDGAVHNPWSGDFVAHYIYRTITVPAASRVPVSIGSDDGVKLFVNGASVLATNVGRGAAADQEKLVLELRPGVNHILMKINNGAGPSGFYFRADLGAAGISAELATAIQASPEKRDAAQREALKVYYRSQDVETAKLEAALAEARKPLPDDPAEKKLEADLASAQKPVAVDPSLDNLRRTVEVSAAQLKNERLTMAQDLTWALINSPAFLFNY